MNEQGQTIVSDADTKRIAVPTSKKTTRHVRRKAAGHNWYFENGGQIHTQTLPDKLVRNEAYSNDFPSSYNAFLINPTELAGFVKPDERRELQKIVLGIFDRTATRKFSRVKPQTIKAIPVHSSKLHAQTTYGTFDAKEQREQLDSYAKFLEHTSGGKRLDLHGEDTICHAVFNNGKLIEAYSKLPRAELRGRSALFAMMLQNAYRPGQLSLHDTQFQEDWLVNPTLDPLSSDLLPILQARVLSELNRPVDALGNLMFNIETLVSGTATVQNDSSYTIKLDTHNSTLGFLFFENNEYVGGHVNNGQKSKVGADALLEALKIYRTDRDAITAVFSGRPSGYRNLEVQGKKATTVQIAADYLANHSRNTSF